MEAVLSIFQSFFSNAEYLVPTMGLGVCLGVGLNFNPTHTLYYHLINILARARRHFV